MADATPLLTRPDDAAAAAAGQPPSWLDGTGGERVRLAAVATVGRADGNDIRIASPAVSRYHAILRESGGRWLLTDLDSRNGTRVNGELIHAPRPLRPNDLIQFGDTSFVLRTGADAAEHRQATGGGTIAAFATAHLHLLFRPSSFAQQQCEVVGARLERFIDVATELFGSSATVPIGVYLLDELAGDRNGYADIAEGVVYAVYRPESPGMSLEANLLELLHAKAAPGAAWPRALSGGVLGYLLRRLDEKPADEDVPALLVEALERDELPPLGALLADDGTIEVAPLAITDVLGYVGSRYGQEAVGRFIQQSSSVSLDKAMNAATGRSLARLDRAWRRRLRSSAVSSFGLFVSLLRPYLRPYRLKIAEIVFYLALSSAFGVALAKINGYLIDRALVPRDARAFWMLMATLGSLFVIASLASLRETYLTAWVSEHLQRELRLTMFSKLQSLHAGYFDHHDSGDLMTRLTEDLDRVQSAFSGGVIGALRMVLMMALALAVIFATAWKLAFIVVVVLPVFLLVGRYLGRPVARLSLEQQTASGKVSSLIQENFGALPVVRLFGLQRLTAGRFAGALDTLLRAAVRLTFFAGLYGVVANSAGTFIQLAVLGVGGYLVLHGHITTGALFAFILLIGQVVGPMQSMTSIFQYVQQATGSLRRVQEVIAAKPAIQSAPGALDLDPLTRDIHFAHVFFGYEGSRRILEDIDLTIPVGASVAFIGASGSGKSTMLNLLARFYDPQLGAVCFDDVDLRQASLESLHGRMGMVFQETVLFNDTVRENIRLGRPEANDDDVEAAARAAELHDFIQGLPEGYDTVVGERGGRLSGGQRQRIAIARAIIRDPALLLLDEATSALDPATEASINATLSRVAAGRTTVSVTHRLASVARLDRIFVFDDGRLVEQGTHQELLARRGTYARLWEEQQGAVAGLAGAQVDADNLRTIPLFAGLDQSTLLWLASNLQAERFLAGAALLRQGEPGDRLYVIREGTVDVLIEDREGRARTLATLREGDYVGEIALLRESPRTATARARTPVEAVSLSRERFQAMLAVSPAMREMVAQTAAQREQGLREAVVTAASQVSPAVAARPRVVS